MTAGYFSLSAVGLVFVTLGLTHITISGVTIYLHRHQTHRALELHPVVSHFFRFWLWLTTGIRTREWVAIHRKHHAKCESSSDPHSPQVFGLAKVLWLGAWLYRQEAQNQETLQKYGKGTPDDWMERKVYRYSFAGIGLMLLIDAIMFGLPGMLVWLVQMAWIPFWAAGVINGIGHYWGYRNYECQDAATNIVPWGVIIAGEELHNNHHTYPGSAKLSSKPWELDLGWMYIRLLQMAGMAEVKKLAPTGIIGPPKRSADTDTLRAVLRNRFQVLAQYSREVLLPVYAEEIAQGQALKIKWRHRARKLLVRNGSLLSEGDHQLLARVLEHSENLQLVYSYKMRLLEIWDGSRANDAGLLHALESWCKQAEAVGVVALEDFARNLRRYTLRSLRDTHCETI